MHAHLGCNREWHTDNPTDDFTDGTWANMLAMENDDKSQLFLKINVFNQYNDLNIGFKVFYHGMAMFYVNLNLEYHIFI